MAHRYPPFNWQFFRFDLHMLDLVVCLAEQASLSDALAPPSQAALGPQTRQKAKRADIADECHNSREGRNVLLLRHVSPPCSLPTSANLMYYSLRQAVESSFFTTDKTNKPCGRLVSLGGIVGPFRLKYPHRPVAGRAIVKGRFRCVYGIS